MVSLRMRLARAVFPLPEAVASRRALLWLIAGVLVMGCDKGEAGSPNQPRASGATGDATRRIEGAPAVLRREMKTCAPADAGAEIEYGVRVSPAGKVVLAKALRSTASAEVLNCTLQRLRAWPFPATATGAAFRFSMTFGREQRPIVRADKDRIKLSVKHRTGQLQHCYNKSLRIDPTITGKLSYKVLIATSGAVTHVLIEGNSGLPASVVQCNVEAIESWTFPMDGATQGTDVSFSIVFSPQ